MPRARTLFWRAIRLRCPHCGGQPLFLSFGRMLPACPSCGLTLERGERGYWLGAYLVGLLALETVLCGWLFVVMAWTWPDIPWTFLHVSTVTILVATPILFYQMSHTIFLAFDLLVHPAEPADFIAPEEARRTERGPRRH